MKKFALALSLSACLISVPAFATCKSDADEKKLAGAALKSFMGKCQRDAQTTCSKQATDQKLKGAAKNSFTKKCVTDALGT